MISARSSHAWINDTCAYGRSPDLLIPSLCISAASLVTSRDPQNAKQEAGKLEQKCFDEATSKVRRIEHELVS